MIEKSKTLIIADTIFFLVTLTLLYTNRNVKIVKREKLDETCTKNKRNA